MFYSMHIIPVLKLFGSPEDSPNPLPRNDWKCFLIVFDTNKSYISSEPHWSFNSLNPPMLSFSLLAASPKIKELPN